MNSWTTNLSTLLKRGQMCTPPKSPAEQPWTKGMSEQMWSYSQLFLLPLSEKKKVLNCPTHQDISCNTFFIRKQKSNCIRYFTKAELFWKLTNGWTLLHLMQQTSSSIRSFQTVNCLFKHIGFSYTKNPQLFTLQIKYQIIKEKHASVLGTFLEILLLLLPLNSSGVSDERFKNIPTVHTP